MRKIILDILLIVIYFFLITPLAFLNRLTGKKFLDTEFKENKSTYWIPTRIKSDDKENYLNLY